MNLPIDNNKIYLLPQSINSPIKILTDEWKLEENNNNMFVLEKKIYPEEMYKVGGKLYMKWHGEWYEMER